MASSFDVVTSLRKFMSTEVHRRHGEVSLVGSGTKTAVTNSTPQGHWLGHLLACKHRERRPTRPKQGLQVWHDTPGQYIECTCKLTTTEHQGKTITWH